MIKHTVTYTDFDGNQQTEDLYFNLTKAEFLRWEMEETEVIDLDDEENRRVEGGLIANIEKLMKGGKGREIMAAFDEIIKRSYGLRSEDGRRFIKSQEISEEFLQTAAYDQFFLWLLEGDNSATFINKLIPAINDADKPTGQQPSLPVRVPGEAIVKAAESSTQIVGNQDGSVEVKDVRPQTDDELLAELRRRGITA